MTLNIICEQALPENAREIIQVVRKLSIREKTFTGMVINPNLNCVLSTSDRKLRNLSALFITLIKVINQR